MEYTSLKIKDLINKSESKELLLPNFQRESVLDRGVATLTFSVSDATHMVFEGKND